MPDSPRRPENQAGVSAETLAAFDGAQSAVEDDVVSMCLAEDEPSARLGDDAEAQIRNGLGFVSRMLRSAMAFGAHGILEDEVEWGKVRLPVYGVSPQMVMKNFERYRAALKRRLPESAYAEIVPFMDGLMHLQRGGPPGAGR